MKKQSASFCMCFHRQMFILVKETTELMGSCLSFMQIHSQHKAQKKSMYSINHN